MDVYIIGNGFVAHELALEARSRGDSVSVIARTKKATDAILQKSGVSIEYVNSPLDYFEMKEFSLVNPSYFILAIGIPSPHLFEIGDVNKEKDKLLKLFELLAFKLLNYPEIQIGYISSGGTVYGDSKTINTEQTICEPVTRYGQFHLTVEQLLLNILGNKLLILRLANPYGEEQTSRHQQGFVAYVYNQICESMPIQLFGYGMQIRDYINIRDASRIINSAMRLENLPGILNVGSGIGTTNLQVAKMAADVMNKEIHYNLVPNRSFDINQNVLSMDLADSLGIPIPPPISSLYLAYLERK